MPDIHRAPLWMSMAAAAGLVDEQGRVGETVFGTMTRLAAAHGAINLGQGAPGTEPPAALLESAARAMRAGLNQYPPGQGLHELITAVAAQHSTVRGREVTPDEVLITVGATEALTSAILALVPAGSDVVVLEPFYDSYAAAVAAAGARLVTVPLLPGADGEFSPDHQAFDAAVTSRTSMIIINTPHNPTGAVLSQQELLRMFSAAQRADAWVLTDEVYEHLIFDDAAHVPLAAAVDEPERIITVSSAGKTFNVTGWKVGWLIAAPEVRLAVQSVKQFLSYAGGTPFQAAIAAELSSGSLFPIENRNSLMARRDVLMGALEQVPGLRVWRPRAGYFALADFSAIAAESAFTLNERITRRYGLTGIPVSALCRTGSATADFYRSTIRYSFCRSPEEVSSAAERLAVLAAEVRSGAFAAQHGDDQ